MEGAPETGDKADRSPDIEGVHRIFTALSSFLSEVSGEFQIIVTEHAGAITWRGVPGVNLVGNWRQGHDEFLIPTAWLGAARAHLIGRASACNHPRRERAVPS